MDEADARRGSARNAADTVIVENDPPYDEWVVDRSMPIMRIGSASDDSMYELDRVRFAARLSDNSYVVVDGGSRTIRWFDQAGRFEHSNGRRGSGPGEFRDFSSAVLAVGDTLIVYDAVNQRLTWFAPDGSMTKERSLRRDGNIDILGERAGVLIAEARPDHAITGHEFRYSRGSLVVSRVDAAGSDTIGVFPGSEAVTWVDYIDGQPRATLQLDLPFGYRTVAAATSGHIVIADGELAELRFYSDSGRLERIAREVRTDRLTTIPAALRAAYIREAVAGVGNATVREERRRSAEERLALVPPSHRIPPFDRVMRDAEGSLWVRDFAIDGLASDLQTWTIYDREAG
jgi:hypothetical protein